MIRRDATLPLTSPLAVGAGVSVETEPVAEDTPAERGSAVSPIEGRRGLPENIFLHYLNPELTALYGVAPKTEEERERFFARAEILTRYALLTSERGIVFPASYLYETSIMRELLRRMTPAARESFVRYSSSTEDLGVFARQKAHEYPDGFREYSTAVSALPDPDLLWVPREYSTSSDIRRRWRADRELPDGVWEGIFRRIRERGERLPRNVATAVERAPEKLDGRAFIMRYVLPFLPKVFGPAEQTLINLILVNRPYLESYLSEYKAAIFIDMPGLGDLDCGLRRDVDQRWTVSFLAVRSVFAAAGLVTAIEQQLDWHELTALRHSGILRWLLARAIEDPMRFQIACDGYVARRQGSFFDVGTWGSGARLESELRELYYHVRPQYQEVSFAAPLVEWVSGSRIGRPVKVVYVQHVDEVTLHKEIVVQITGSIVNLDSVLVNVVQTIGAAPVPDDKRKEFESLVEEIRPLLEQLQRQQPASATNIADALDRTAKYAGSPDPATRSLLRSTGEGLLAAAKAVAEYVPGLVDAIEKVVKWIQSLS